MKALPAVRPQTTSSAVAEPDISTSARGGHAHNREGKRADGK